MLVTGGDSSNVTQTFTNFDLEVEKDSTPGKFKGSEHLRVVSPPTKMLRSVQTSIGSGCQREQYRIIPPGHHPLVCFLGSSLTAVQAAG